jgi:hypothetical protein
MSRPYFIMVSASASLRQLFKLVLVYSLFLAVPCAAQVAHKKEPGPSEAERPASEARSFMELFTKLERDWTLALQKKDEVALDAIVAPEFMLRTSENPENPLPRTDWIHHELTRCDIRAFDHRGMAIRSFLGVAVVSFVESLQGTMNGNDCSTDYFVVDIWESNHGKWQASARYVAPVKKHLAGGINVPEMSLPRRTVSAGIRRIG